MAVSGPISGIAGLVTINKNVIAMKQSTPEVIGHIRNWTADFRRDITPDDRFETSSENFKKFIGGMHDIVGTCEGWMDSVLAYDMTTAAGLTAADYVPDSGDTIELIARQGSVNLSYKFAAILSNVNMQVRKSSELNRFTLSFQSTGTIVALDWVTA